MFMKPVLGFLSRINQKGIAHLFASSQYTYISSTTVQVRGYCTGGAPVQTSLSRLLSLFSLGIQLQTVPRVILYRTALKKMKYNRTSGWPLPPPPPLLPLLLLLLLLLLPSPVPSSHLHLHPLQKSVLIGPKISTNETCCNRLLSFLLLLYHHPTHPTVLLFFLFHILISGLSLSFLIFPFILLLLPLPLLLLFLFISFSLFLSSPSAFLHASKFIIIIYWAFFFYPF